MRLLPHALIGLIAAAQSAPPLGLVEGTYVDREGTEQEGELVVRTANNRLFRCNYDAKSYFERQQKRIPASFLEAGDSVELVTDQAEGGSRCYVRVLHQLETARRRAAGRTPLPRWRNPTEDLFPRGDLTYAGVVRRVTPEHLVLRLRGGVQKDVLLRDDTRYLEGGGVVSRSDLSINTRVFVRGGKNLYGEVEAYQVVWGAILDVR
ncbi:MAG: hypothetical protein NTY38_22350 [Acidobacteria bacterium]|nr:hypothetical protein [Acidobacteriota bacterium]